MKAIEGSKRFDIADYMKNFSRESQSRDSQIDTNSSRNKLTLADLQAARSKSTSFFVKDTSED
jgi:hypothetical protein